MCLTQVSQLKVYCRKLPVFSTRLLLIGISAIAATIRSKMKNSEHRGKHSDLWLKEAKVGKVVISDQKLHVL
jgi:hypothetical protein